MKAVLILPDGAADHPLAELDHRTPLAAAQIPYMDAIARQGRIGRAQTIPAGYVPGTDVGSLSLFGYDPRQDYPGRAPLEAAARNLPVGPDEVIFRCNFVTIANGRMADFTADHIEQPDADELIAVLNEALSESGCRFYSGVGYRNLMVAPVADPFDLMSTAPHDIPNQPVADALPRGAGSGWVCQVMERAAHLLRNHPVNERRQAAGRPPVTDIWLWGQGRAAALAPLTARFGLRGVTITGVDIIRGLSRLAGLDLLEVQGVTDFIDNDYVAQGQAALDALDAYDLVVVHVEAPDEAAHMGDAVEKIRALEQIDRHIVGPLLRKLRKFDDWRIMIAPDHPTLVSTKAHHADPPCYCYAGSLPAPSGAQGFNEIEAERVGDYLRDGHVLLERFLRQTAVPVTVARSA
jgi:2,3-bisphosphoglycerate-independent phosphoglycerate mutase